VRPAKSGGGENLKMSALEMLARLALEMTVVDVPAKIPIYGSSLGPTFGR
jgi:hypothetical protein